MRELFLDTPEDLAWLAEVHCPIARGYPYAILYGNEDSPTKVELFADNRITCVPTVLEMDQKDRKLKVTSWGTKYKEKL